MNIFSLEFFTYKEELKIDVKSNLFFFFGISPKLNMIEDNIVKDIISLIHYCVIT